jgi:tetratricopeptide (TPR) repeat protein
MDKLSVLTRLVVIAAIPSFLFTGCTKEGRKSRLLSKAENDLKAGAYDKAKIEYLNVLRLGGQNPTAFARLGQIWLDEGAPLKAAPFLLKAKELTPNDLENRLRLAQVYNAVGKRDDARKETLFVLQHSPGSGEALLLSTQMAFTPVEIGAAEKNERWQLILSRQRHIVHGLSFYCFKRNPKKPSVNLKQQRSCRHLAQV